MTVKRAKRTNYTQKTLRALREAEYCVDICERWNPFGGFRRPDPANPGQTKPTGVRVDLFGFIDIIGIPPDRSGIVAVQCTGPSGFADHKRKILANEFAPHWLQAGGRIELWAWRKLIVKKGGKLKRWVPRIEEITLEMFLDNPEPEAITRKYTQPKPIVERDSRCGKTELTLF